MIMALTSIKAKTSRDLDISLFIDVVNWLVKHSLNSRSIVLEL